MSTVKQFVKHAKSMGFDSVSKADDWEYAQACVMVAKTEFKIYFSHSPSIQSGWVRCEYVLQSGKHTHWQMSFEDFLAMTSDQLDHLKKIVDAARADYEEATKRVRAIPASYKKRAMAAISG